MAEATDRPRDAGEVPSGGAAAGTGEPHVTAWPEQGGATGLESGAMPAPPSEPYRPLSLQALAGFGVAAVYALVVVVGAAVALVNHMPYLMPKWSFLVPVAAIVLCWVARARIRSSEDTLSGLSFTTWGVRLSVLVGLCYAAYYGSTYFALRQQAKKCAEDFFTYLKQGNPERAYMLSMDPSLRSLKDDELRNMIESTHNAPSGPSQRPGPFTMFRQSDFVRLLQEGGEQSRLDLLGVSDWGHEPGGYQVTLKYQVHTPAAEFQVTVGTFSPDAKPGERPQWHILLRRGETHSDPASRKLTPEGEKLMAIGSSAQGFVNGWLNKFAEQAWDDVYLDTLPPAERARLRPGARQARLLRTAPVSGLGPLALSDESFHDFLKGRKTLTESKLIRIDKDTFWSSKQQRDSIIERVRQTFRPAREGNVTCNIRLLPSQIPMLRTAGGEVTFLFDTQMLYREEGANGPPQYTMEGRIAVSGKQGEVEDNSSAWRIVEIELLSGRSTPMAPPGERQQGGAGQPGMIGAPSGLPGRP
jgi:hypothetical protein